MKGKRLACERFLVDICRARNDNAVYRDARAGQNDDLLTDLQRFYVNGAFYAVFNDGRGALLHFFEPVYDVAPAHYAALLKKMSRIEYQRYQHGKYQVAAEKTGDYRYRNEYLHCVCQIFCDYSFYRCKKYRNALNEKACGVEQRGNGSAGRKNRGINKTDNDAGYRCGSADYFAPQLFFAAVCQVVA